MATRWGILGAGKISHDFATCLNALPKDEHRIVAIASSRLEAAKQFAENHGIEEHYGSYTELANDPSVEVAYIGLLNNQHLAAVKLMLENGKHVLCEKPMGMDVAETLEMVTLARKKKLFLMEAVWSRCFPTYERLRQEIASGSLGELCQVNVTFCREIYSVDRVVTKELGGSVTLDIGIYALQLVSMVFGGKKPQKIVAGGHVNSEGVDTDVAVVLVYDNGQLASLNYSGKVTATSEAVIIGTKAEAKLEDPFWSSTSLTVAKKPAFNIELPQVQQKVNFKNSEGLTYEAQEVRKCLKAGLLECPLMKLDESLFLAEMMQEIRNQVEKA